LRLDEHNSSDIRKYVKRKFPVQVNGVIQSMQTELIRKSDGVFLWAVLVSKQVLVAIDKGKPGLELTNLLTTIPTELDDLFDDIFREVELSVVLRQVLLCISEWILCSQRPLTAPELATALQLEATDQQRGSVLWNPTPRGLDNLGKRILDVSGGLFESIQTLSGRKVQVIHESVRDFFVGSKGRRLLQVASVTDFNFGAHQQMALVCLRALLSAEFSTQGAAVKVAASASIPEIIKLLGASWQPPENHFLEDYVQDHVFEHFDLARASFSEDPTGVSLRDSVKMRREAFVNFLRLSCHQLTEGQRLRPNFSTHLQKVSKDPAAFGLDGIELWTLLSFLNNLSACRTVFRSRHVYMHDLSTGPSSTKCNKYLALFFATKELGEALRDFMIGNTVGSICKIPSVSFVFGVSFKVSFRGDASNTTYRLLELLSMRNSEDSESAPGRMPLYMQDWAIEDNFDTIADLIEGGKSLLRCRKSQLHDYRNPRLLCAVLEGIEGSKDPSSQDLLPKNLIYSDSIISCVPEIIPAKSIWRPKSHEDGRDVFEESHIEADDINTASISSLASIPSINDSLEVRITSGMGNEIESGSSRKQAIPSYQSHQ
jgi:hypothetical protein